MESEETKRNDEILSRLDDDEDEDEELPTSRVSLSGRKYRRDDYLSIPCSSLRTFLKKENELKEVNARYHKMMEKLKAEKANHASSSPSPSMQEEEMECVSPELRDSVIPGEIDSLVEENNLRNSRLFVLFFILFHFRPEVTFPTLLSTLRTFSHHYCRRSKLLPTT